MQGSGLYAQTTRPVVDLAAEPIDVGPTTVATQTVIGGGDLFPSATPANVLKVTQRVFPAVVRIDVAQETYENGKRTLQRGIGSGVIIDGQGHILTNYHVAGRSAEIFITLANKERVAGKLIGDDHWTDLAVVQMNLEEVERKQFKFTYAELGDSSKLVPGQDVIAIGTPFGLARTVTLGVVSNTERTFYPETQNIDGYETGDFSNWIQMDTPIAPGNSGGPLVDLDGRVVGINTRGIQGQGLNFAIPIDTARSVAAAILQSATDGKKGRVTRASLGIDFRPLQDLESFYDIDMNKGALISSVEKDSPASKAGLKPQDILLAIDDQPVNVRFPEEIASIKHRISSLPLDKSVSLKVRRGADEMAIVATPIKLESRVGEERELTTWGASVRDVTRALATQLRLDDDKGVVVTSIRPGLPGAKAGLEPGDVIKKLNAIDVVDLEDFLSRTEKAVAEGEAQSLLTIQRGRGVKSIVIESK